MPSLFLWFKCERAAHVRIAIDISTIAELLNWMRWKVIKQVHGKCFYIFDFQNKSISISNAVGFVFIFLLRYFHRFKYFVHWNQTIMMIGCCICERRSSFNVILCAQDDWFGVKLQIICWSFANSVGLMLSKDLGHKINLILFILYYWTVFGHIQEIKIFNAKQIIGFFFCFEFWKLRI